MYIYIYIPTLCQWSRVLQPKEGTSTYELRYCWKGFSIVPRPSVSAFALEKCLKLHSKTKYRRPQ